MASAFAREGQCAEIMQGPALKEEKRFRGGEALTGHNAGAKTGIGDGAGIGDDAGNGAGSNINHGKQPAYLIDQFTGVKGQEAAPVWGKSLTSNGKGWGLPRRMRRKASCAGLRR